MIRALGIALCALAITGCGDDSPKSKLGAINKDVSKLSHHLKNNKKKFDHVYKHLGVINKQLPKLNKKIQDQISNQAAENNASIKKASASTKSQFKHLQNEINNFGKEMAAKGY